MCRRYRVLSSLALVGSLVAGVAQTGTISPPEPIPESTEAPAIPLELKGRGLKRHVIMEYTVDAQGAVEHIVPVAKNQAQDSFTDSIRSALSKRRYVPAQQNGTPQPYILREAFEWEEAPISLSSRSDPLAAATTSPPGINPMRKAEIARQTLRLYPPVAFNERVEATVPFELVVDDLGKIESSRPLAPSVSGYGFAEAALQLLPHVHFSTPARRNGLAIRCVYVYEVKFRLP